MRHLARTVIGKLNVFGHWRRMRQQRRMEQLRNKHSGERYLVYTMGKVGSTTVCDILWKQHPYLKTYHIHFLSDHWLKERLPKLDPFFHTNIPLGEEILEDIRKHPGVRLKIITLMRDPLIRDISDVFQNWKGLFGVKSIKELDYQKVTEYLNQLDHEYSLHWFDTEFRNYTGFDLYNVPFDQQRGWSVYHIPFADVLCIQLERLNEVFPEAMKAFSGLDCVMSASSNTTEEKEGKELYALLKNNYNPSAEKLDLIYQSKMMTHFYSAAQLEKFRKKWERTT